MRERSPSRWLAIGAALAVWWTSIASCSGDEPGTGAGAGGTAAGSSHGGQGGASVTSATQAGGGIDCSTVGCAPPPTCAEGCTEPCGCCACGEGETMGGLVCKGGCYAPLDDAGAGDGG